MPYVEITETDALRDAAATFSGHLLQGAQVVETPQASDGHYALLWHPHVSLWAHACSSLLDGGSKWRRAPAATIYTRWSFGTSDPAESAAQGAMDAMCEMTCLAKKFKRNREAVFLKDAEGQVWLAHRGLLKEAPKPGKQAKDVPLSDDRVFLPQDFPRVGPFGEARHPVMVIGRLGDESFLEQLAHFVHDLNHYKHGGPTGAERLEELRKSQSWTDKAMSFFKRK